MMKLILSCLAAVSFVSCVTPSDPADGDPFSANRGINERGDLVLKEIPPLPPGREFKATEPSFRTRKLALPDGLWNVSLEGGNITIVNPSGKTSRLAPEWYPEEGGADAASCSARVEGSTVWIILSGSSDYYDEVTRIRFQKRVMKEVIKHRIPGGLPGAVPPEDRIKSAVF